MHETKICKHCRKNVEETHVWHWFRDLFMFLFLHLLAWSNFIIIAETTTFSRIRLWNIILRCKCYDTTVTRTKMTFAKINLIFRWTSNCKPVKGLLSTCGWIIAGEWLQVSFWWERIKIVYVRFLLHFVVLLEKIFYATFPTRKSLSATLNYSL